MNIEQRSTGRGDLAEMVVAAGSRESPAPTRDREWQCFLLVTYVQPWLSTSCSAQCTRYEIRTF